MTEPANPPSLLPCPFCGKPAGICTAEDEKYVVACDWCWAEGASGYNAEQAASLWNRRAEPTAALTEARAAGFADALREIEVRATALEVKITNGTWDTDTETQARELRTMASLLRRKAQEPV